MKLKFFIIFSSFLILGCTWSHPNSNPQQFANDKLECQAMANRMYPNSFVPNLQVFNTCLEGKGYTK